MRKLTEVQLATVYATLEAHNACQKSSTWEDFEDLDAICLDGYYSLHDLRILVNSLTAREIELLAFSPTTPPLTVPTSEDTET